MLLSQVEGPVRTGVLLALGQARLGRAPTQVNRSGPLFQSRIKRCPRSFHLYIPRSCSKSF
jgi:hypothetical protein